MIDNKEKLEILNALRKDNFLHDSDFEKKLSSVLNNLSNEDKKIVNSLSENSEKENKSKKIQIDFFSMIILEREGLLSTELIKGA